QTLALRVAGWRGPFLLDILWLFVASVGVHLLLRALTGDLVVAVFGQLVYPLFLTGINYYPGYSETPPLSLLPLLGYLLYRGSPIGAGLVAAAILFLKVNLFPVVGAVVIVAVLPGATPRLRGRGLLPLVAATSGGVALIFLVL